MSGDQRTVERIPAAATGAERGRSDGTILAVDGGNSKADVALITAQGTLLAAARGATISHQAVALPVAVGRLAEIVAAVRAQAPAAPAPRHAVLCLAGADYASDVRLLRAAFSAVVPTAETIVLNDTFAALRAGTTRPWGIALICGQGINAAAVGPSGRRVRFAGVGDISGDWGGGTSVGMAGLGAAVRARDGRGPRTALERTIPLAVALHRPEQVTRAFYDGRLDGTQVGDLAPVVFATASDGDPVARAIVDRLADELAVMAAALARRAGLSRRDPDVVLAGSVFKAKDAAFHARLAERIGAAIPRAKIVRLDAPPVLGSALIGLDRLSGGLARVDPEVQARLGGAIRAWSETARVVTSS
ncbi:MAG TPA: BadF/BadG/BcrA/BcrD ATPase family protein [Candidatus Limnocylindrales bacterium]|nr:BadF/BadG/BcrA/BcrD ATPase family protein [Candidatus Limnocylindrales bacterium]